MGLDLVHASPASKGLEYLTLEELSLNPVFIDKYKHLLIEIEIEKENNEIAMDPVLYYTERGYQRKGMNKEFYKDFENCKIHFDLASVIKASYYLAPQGPDYDVALLKKNFQDNFINNFIEGKSFFFASW